MAHKVGAGPMGDKNGGVPEGTPPSSVVQAARWLPRDDQKPIVSPRLTAQLCAMRSLSKSWKSFASATLFQSSDVM